MKYFVVKADHNPNELAIVGAKGFTPKDMICPAPLMPDGSVCTDPSLITLVEEYGPFAMEPMLVAKVDEAKVAAKVAAQALAVAEAEAVKYKAQRASEYPSIQDLLEAIMEEKEGRPEKMQAVISKRSEVRVKYPKGV